MSIGNVLKLSRDTVSLTQKQITEKLPLSRSMVASIENGTRHLPKDVAPLAVHSLDNGFLAMEIATELTGGSWVTMLNGDNVDLHRSAVKEKAVEELEELINRLHKTSLAARNPDQGELKVLLQECLDAIVAVSHLVAVVCQEYAISWVGLWKEHRVKLKARGYLKGE